MMKVRTALVTGALLACGAGAQAQEAVRVGSLTARAWQGGAYREAGGGFSHCILSERYGPNVEVGLRADARGLVLIIANNAWMLTPGQSYPVTVRVPGHWEGVRGSVARTGQELRVDFGQDETAIQAIRHGSRLSVIGAPPIAELKITLHGTLLAVDSVRACHAQHRAMPVAAAAAGRAAAPGMAAAIVSPAVTLSHVFTYTGQRGICVQEFMVSAPAEGPRIDTLKVSLLYDLVQPVGAEPAGRAKPAEIDFGQPLGGSRADQYRRATVELDCAVRNVAIKGARGTIAGQEVPVRAAALRVQPLEIAPEVR